MYQNKQALKKSTILLNKYMRSSSLNFNKNNGYISGNY